MRKGWLFLVLIFAGCQPPKSSGKVTTGSNPNEEVAVEYELPELPETQLSGTIKDIEKFTFSPALENQELNLYASPIAVQVVLAKQGDNLSYVLKAQDTVIETEKYQMKDGQLYFLGTDEEELIPPLPLIKNGMKPNDHVKWKGVVKSVGKSQSAEGESNGGGEVLDTVSPVDAIRIAYKLKIGGPKAVERTYSFWIAPKAGVVKRTTSLGFTRQPVPRDPMDPDLAKAVPEEN